MTSSQWLNPARYADLSLIVSLTASAAVPGAYLWAELAALPSGSSAGAPLTPYAAACLVVTRTFAEGVLARATAAAAGGPAVPPAWSVAESDEEAADLAAADRSGRKAPLAEATPSGGAAAAGACPPLPAPADQVCGRDGHHVGEARNGLHARRQAPRVRGRWGVKRAALT